MSNIHFNFFYYICCQYVTNKNLNGSADETH